MKKRILLCSLAVLGAMTLGGCGAIELTDEESELISTYAAGTLLNYSEDYEDRLVLNSSGSAISVSQSAVTTTPTPQETATPSASPDATDNPTQTDVPDATKNPNSEVAMNELYGVSGAQFSYKNYEFCKEYPKKASAYQIIANEEEVLFVVKFNIKNTSGRKMKVDLMNRKISYPLSVDGFEYKPTISVLENGGLNFLSTTIGKGKTEEAVLIYSVPRKVKNATELSLSIQDGKKQTTIKLK